MKIVKYLISLLLVTTTVMAEPAVQHMVFAKTPLKIYLPLNGEKIIKFPTKVSLDSRALKFVKAELANGYLYLIPKYKFTNKRIYLKSDKEVFLLDLTVSQNANHNMVEIVLPDEEDIKINNTKTISPIELARFAIQQFYGPERLQTSANVKRIAMKIAPKIELYPNANITVHPNCQYQTGNLYITALTMKNNRETPVELDPRIIKGQFKAAIFYPNNRLASNKEPGDDTMLFLIATKPIAEIIARLYD